MNFIDIIPNICEGLPFMKGDFVLLNFWGEDKDIEIVNLFCGALSKKGIIPFRHSCSRDYLVNTVTPLIQDGQEFPAEYFQFLGSFKHVIDIFMYSPKLPDGIPTESLPGVKKHFRSLFSSLSSNKKYYIQLRVPTLENAMESGMDYETYKDILCNALTVDFPDLRSSCRDTKENLSDKSIIKIHTGNDCTLDLSIRNREWFLDDGCGDLPAGEVYIAPLESSAEGRIYFPEVYFEGEMYKGVIMAFERGRLKSCSCAAIECFFKNAPEEFSILSEFGIGLNPRVKELTGYTPVDEKALGTYHIALGMNNMFGGENACPFHMDFVFRSDMVEFE